MLYYRKSQTVLAFTLVGTLLIACGPTLRHMHGDRSKRIDESPSDSPTQRQVAPGQTDPSDRGDLRPVSLNPVRPIHNGGPGQLRIKVTNALSGFIAFRDGDGDWTKVADGSAAPEFMDLKITDSKGRFSLAVSAPRDDGKVVMAQSNLVLTPSLSTLQPAIDFGERLLHEATSPAAPIKLYAEFKNVTGICGIYDGNVRVDYPGKTEGDCSAKLAIQLSDTTRVRIVAYNKGRDGKIMRYSWLLKPTITAGQSLTFDFTGALSSTKATIIPALVQDQGSLIVRWASTFSGGSKTDEGIPDAAGHTELDALIVEGTPALLASNYFYLFGGSGEFHVELNRLVTSANPGPAVDLRPPFQVPAKSTALAIRAGQKSGVEMTGSSLGIDVGWDEVYVTATVGDVEWQTYTSRDWLAVGGRDKAVAIFEDVKFSDGHGMTAPTQLAQTPLLIYQRQTRWQGVLLVDPAGTTVDHPAAVDDISWTAYDQAITKN